LIRHWSNLDYHAFYKASALDNKTISDFALNNFSLETLEYLLQPVLSGIFYWSPEHTSQAMLFVLLRAALPAIRTRLFTLKHGLGQLPKELAKNLLVYENSPVTSVIENTTGKYLVNTLLDGKEKLLEADAVVCAIPASKVAALFPKMGDNQRTFFRSIEYSSTAILASGIKRRLSENIYGIFFPREEKNIKSLAAATIQSAKNLQQVPKGHDLIGLYSSGQAGSLLIHKDDDFIRSVLLNDLRELGESYNFMNETTFNRIYRWDCALPLYDKGHFKRLKNYMDGKIDLPGRLVFAGDYLEGPFIEGAITSGLNAANKLIEKLRIK
jgi:oxygen-dependent protoporphyrinogen oxidase